MPPDPTNLSFYSISLWLHQADLYTSSVPDPHVQFIKHLTIPTLNISYGLASITLQKFKRFTALNTDLYSFHFSPFFGSLHFTWTFSNGLHHMHLNGYFNIQNILVIGFFADA